MHASRLLSIESWKKWLWSFVRLVLIAGLSFVILYPILQKIATAIKDKTDLYSPIVVWIPEHFSLDNFKQAIEIMDYWATLRNTFALSAMTTLLDRFILRARRVRLRPVEIQREQSAVRRRHSDHFGSADDDPYSRLYQPEGFYAAGFDSAAYGEIGQSVKHLLALYSYFADGQFIEGGTLYFHFQAVFQGNTKRSRGSGLY